MPEGDTIHQLVAELEPRLVGRTLQGGRLRDEPGFPLDGRVVQGVRAHGKHLWIELADGRSIRSHLGMYGSWHRYAHGERWRKPPRRASIVLETERDVLVCFQAKEVDVVLDGDGSRLALERRLGPDLCVPRDEWASLPPRARTKRPPETPLVDILLDQSIASGIGNVYTSELLFLFGLHPRRPLGATTDATLEELYRHATELLLANARRGGTRRTDARAIHDEGTRPQTAASGALWVYRRAGEPCRRCTTAIANARLGRHRRSTYWCPTCQPDPRAE